MAYKPRYEIVKGNIADYEGGAIVVPSWANMSTGNAISHAINKKLGDLQVDPEGFWPEPSDIRDASKKVPLFSAHFFESPQLPMVDAYILATCYVDEEESKPPFSQIAAKTTENVLKVASERGIESLAFPILMTGHGGGRLDEIVPSMIDEFNTHLRTGKRPSYIALYVFGDQAHEQTLQLVRQIS